MRAAAAFLLGLPADLGEFPEVMKRWSVFLPHYGVFDSVVQVCEDDLVLAIRDHNPAAAYAVGVR